MVKVDNDTDLLRSGHRNGTAIRPAASSLRALKLWPDNRQRSRLGNLRPAPNRMAGPGGACSADPESRDGLTAGLLHLSGDFLVNHHEEILDRLHDLGHLACTTSPCPTAVTIRGCGSSILVATRDPALPPRLARELRHSFGGTIRQHYDVAERFLLVTWRREGDTSNNDT